MCYWLMTSAYPIMNPNIQVPVRDPGPGIGISALLHLGAWVLLADERQAVEEVVLPIDLKTI